MPFKSEKQRAFMWSQHPDIAKRWAREGFASGGEVAHNPISSVFAAIDHERRASGENVQPFPTGEGPTQEQVSGEARGLLNYVQAPPVAAPGESVTDRFRAPGESVGDFIKRYGTSPGVMASAERAGAMYAGPVKIVGGIPMSARPGEIGVGGTSPELQRAAAAAIEAEGGIPGYMTERAAGGAPAASPKGGFRESGARVEPPLVSAATPARIENLPPGAQVIPHPVRTAPPVVSPDFVPTRAIEPQTEFPNTYEGRTAAARLQAQRVLTGGPGGQPPAIAPRSPAEIERLRSTARANEEIQRLRAQEEAAAPAPEAAARAPVSPPGAVELAVGQPPPPAGPRVAAEPEGVPSAAVASELGDLDPGIQKSIFEQRLERARLLNERAMNFMKNPSAHPNDRAWATRWLDSRESAAAARSGTVMIGGVKFTKKPPAGKAHGGIIERARAVVSGSRK